MVLLPLSFGSDHHQGSLQSCRIGAESCKALWASFGQLWAHHGIVGRHNNPATYGGGVLFSPPLVLRCWSRRSDPTASSTYTSTAPSPFQRRTPEEGMGRPVVLAGVAEQASAGGWQADGVDEILQDAVLHVGEGVVVQRFLEEEMDQWGFEGLVSKLAQGLQDSSNSQVVVLGP